MKNRKRPIEIINKFPPILDHLKKVINQEDIDFILDASSYESAASLSVIVQPHLLLLNINLSSSSAIELADTLMQDNPMLNLAMIISDPTVYQLNLNSTVNSKYFIDPISAYKLIPAIVSNKQLN